MGLASEYLGLPCSSNSSSMQETRVQSLGQEDPLEKGMAIRSSILAWRIPWTEEPGKLEPMGSQKTWTQLSDFLVTSSCTSGS